MLIHRTRRGLCLPEMLLCRNIRKYVRYAMIYFRKLRYFSELCDIITVKGGVSHGRYDYSKRGRRKMESD